MNTSTSAKTVQKGDLYLYDFGESSGSVQEGRRPVLIIQADSFNRNSSTTIVAAVTGAVKKTYLPSHIELPEGTGLDRPSMVLLEQMRTVEIRTLGKYLGHLYDKAAIKQIDSGLKKTLGLWSYRKEHQENIRCLCGNCAGRLINTVGMSVRRLDPFCEKKVPCQKCGSEGYEYIVFESKERNEE